MKKLCVVLLLSVVVMGFSGCIGSAPVEAMKSPITADWKAPLNTNLKDVTLGSKIGKASVKCYAFGLVSSGDMSIQAAAANGGIKTIRHVDYGYTNAFFFAYQELTTIVYGD